MFRIFLCDFILIFMFCELSCVILYLMYLSVRHFGLEVLKCFINKVGLDWIFSTVGSREIAFPLQSNWILIQDGGVDDYREPVLSKCIIFRQEISQSGRIKPKLFCMANPKPQPRFSIIF